MNFFRYITFVFILIFCAGCSDFLEPSEQIEKENEQVITENTEVVEQTPTEETKTDEKIIEEELSEQLSITPVVSSKPLNVHFVDVGQGDAVIVQAPNGRAMLIDGGNWGKGQEVVQYNRSLGIDQLEYVVATHPDADHIGGLIAVLNSIKIKNFIDSGKEHTSETYEKMLSLIETKHIPYIVPNIGDQLKLDEEMQIEVLNVNSTASDNNDASIVLKLTYGEVSFLLMADAESNVENQLRVTKDVRATVLKIGHHGSNTSSSKSFIQAVQPEVAILSYANDNEYGHPHAETIENLREIQSKIYGTGESGTITVTTNGTTYEVDKAEWTGIGATSSIKNNVPNNSSQNNDAGEVANNSTQNNGVVTNNTSNGIVISSKDLYGEIVGITNNTSEKVSLKGWQLVSVQGNQIFKFPNISLNPGSTIYITSGPKAKEGHGYLKWTNRSMWLNDGDKAILKNANGEIVDEMN